MAKGAGKKKRKCVLCWTEFGAGETDKFLPLEHFEDLCYCKECLRKEKEGAGSR